jgi:homoserine O-acetyltransferase
MPMETFELGNFQLTTGYTIPNAKLSYKTHGTLNARKDNVILFPNFLGGVPEALEIYIGEGMALDPRKYFIILPGQIGNGVSSSPSNTPPPYNQGNFPPVNIADDVIAQHRMLTEGLGIQELQLVLGWSVGSLQTFEWAVRFPDMVKRMASIAGAPRPSAATQLWLRVVIEEPITSDPTWNNGFYPEPAAVQTGLRRQAHCMALTLPPLGFYRDEVWRSIGFASQDDFVRGFFEGFMLSQDPNNLVSQSRKARAANPGGTGDMAAALGSIKAKSFIAAFNGDMMFPPEECRMDAERIPGAQYREIRSLCGHLATFALFEQDKKAIDDVIREALAA